MASSKFIVVLALFFTCLALANSAPFGSKPWEQTEMVNPNDIDTGVKEPEQWGGGYTGWCRHGCCYAGRNGCLRCCRYANEETNSVGKRSHSQVAEKSPMEEEASRVWAQSRP
ncbi:unnamed protein product [Thlaspi arvense]|uniref:Uncharacterized protein n=1 Tax=Thlaspi arvense TaxID=13288 RepID=A0AAU9RM53_THLAR|nr:unnamed protein product [Thlaspi arvense]